jgi:hypothetical protein
MNVLLTSQDFSAVLGLAYTNQACNPNANHLLVSSHRNIDIGNVLAHELGHSFGADHDSGVCQLPNSRFLINLGATPGIKTFSQCSINQINSKMNTKSCIK